MRLHLVSPSQLSPADLNHWLSLHRSGPDFKSPYFHPKFTQTVGEVRDDTEVAILEDPQKPLGFFPFQRERLGFGKPVGGSLSDHHGAIVPDQLTWSADWLIRSAGLKAWDFDHLIFGQPAFAPYHHSVSESPLMDLKGGFDQYLLARRRQGGQRIGQTLRKARKAERECGSVKFVPHTDDDKVFDWVIELKRQQCRSTGVVDFFGWGWPLELVKRISQLRAEGFAGILSALYINDVLAAAHLGMHSQEVLHWWFPVYSTRFAKYSPGGILLLKTAEHFSQHGIKTIDLGKGDDPYKRSFMTHSIPLAEGSVELESMWTSGRRWQRLTEARLRRSAWAASLRSSVQRAKRSLGL